MYMSRHSFKSAQSGFALVEALVIIVVLAAVSGAGYAVYHAHHKSAAKTSASKSTGKANGGKGGNSSPDTGPAKTESYLILEWGVTADIPAPPEDAALIQYKIGTGTTASAGFTTQELIDAGGDACSADHMPAGSILRAKPSDPFYLEDGSASGQTVGQVMASDTFTPNKKVGDYFYWYVHSQAACGDPAKTKTLQSAAATQVQHIVSNLRVQQN